MAPVDSSFLIQEDFAIYREKSKQFMSSHQLADFRKCPSLWRRKNEGIIPAVKSESFSFGSAAHTLILEGKQKFENDFAVGGPINPKTGKEYGADNGVPFPNDAEEAAGIADGGGLKPAKRIKVRTTAGEAFERIIGYEFGEISYDDAEAAAVAADDQTIPF